MGLNSSGPISLAGTTAGVSIEIENGGNGTTQISLNDTAVRTLAGVPSGTITMPTNFYGKSNQYTYTISSNQTNFCMRAGAVSAGWNGSSALAVTINSGVIISSNSTGTPAMTITGSFPGGVTVTNNGTIVGMGGAGGRGAFINYYSASSGSAAGTAVKVLSAVTFNNVGTIAGGGGGGGGGSSSSNAYGQRANGGGGGGGRSSNAENCSGGSGGGSCRPFCVSPGSAGCAGTYSSAGGGGGGGFVCTEGSSASGGSGGSGGGWGAVGGSAAAGGGSGGNATCGAGTYITWTGTGTRYGSIS